MSYKIIKVIQKDYTQTNLVYYSSTSNPKANLLLLHGMAEHHKRYVPFINFLTSNGIDVYTYNHRGHGHEHSTDELGYFAEEDGDTVVVNDAISILSYLKKQSPDIPLYLMGHSMGSLITRNVIQEYDNINGVILCGTSNPRPIASKLGLLYMDLLQYKKKQKVRSKHMDGMLFGTRSYSKWNKNTNVDWLCSDPKEVEKYVQDPYCGFICTMSFYHDLITLALKAATPNRMLRTKKDLKFFIISGADDPVGGHGKDVLRLVNFYQSHGYDVQSKLYSGCRHEILLDRKKEEAYHDVLSFLQSNL